MTNPFEIQIRIRCEKIPIAYGARFPGFRLGIQKGDQVIDDAPVDRTEATFLCTAKVRRNEADGRPRFSGPFVKGTPASQFIYLCWGERAGEEWVGRRRAKLLLAGLDWVLISSTPDPERPVEVFVDMTDNRGEPACASLPANKIRWVR